MVAVVGCVVVSCLWIAYVGFEALVGPLVVPVSAFAFGVWTLRTAFRSEQAARQISHALGLPPV